MFNRIWSLCNRPSKSSLALVMSGLTMVVLVVVTGVDRPIATYASTLRESPVEVVFKSITDLGRGVWYLVPTGSLAILFLCAARKTKGKAISERLISKAHASAFIFISVAVSGLSVNLLKIIFGRLRPKWFLEEHRYGFTFFALHHESWSFPSGHAASAVAFAAAIYWLTPRARRVFLVPLITFVAMVALSRIVITMHFLSDVMAGTLVALVWTCCLHHYVFDRVARRRLAVGISGGIAMETNSRKARLK